MDTRAGQSFGWRISATLSFVAMIVTNGLANALPINGLTTGDVANRYPSLFTPAGLTFSIWSLIYLLLAAFLVQSWRQPQNDRINTVLPAFTLTNLLNLTWILVWHHLMPGISIVVMSALLITLIIIFRKLQGSEPRTKGNVVLVSIPFSVYLAWISVATIANIASWLSATTLAIFVSSPEIWTIIMMIVAALLAGFVVFKFHAPVYGVVVIWALLGIFLRWKGSDYQLIQVTAIVLIVGLAITSVAVLFRRQRTTVGG